MNLYLRKRCAALLAAVMMATSTVSPVMAAGNDYTDLQTVVEESLTVKEEVEISKNNKAEGILIHGELGLQSYGSDEYAKEYGNLKYRIDSGRVRIVGYVGSPSEIIIPDEIEGLPVTWIEDDAFKGCISLTLIQFPKNEFRNWDYIEYGMLEGCTNLKQIKVDPENPVIKSIDGILYSKDGKTLHYCPNAKSGKITIPEGVEELTSGAFFKCTKVTEITLPSTAKKIAWFRIENMEYAYGGTFSGCTSLTSIKVSSKNPLYKSVDGCVYSKDGKSLYVVPNGKKGVFTVPKGVTTIGEKESEYGNEFRPFDSCNQITKIIIPETVKTLAGIERYDYNDGGETFTRAFLGCSKLEAISVDSKNTVYSSEKGVLYNKEKSRLICCPSYIKSISIPKTVSKISYNAFYNCTRLKKVELPSRVNQFEKSSVVESGFDLYFNCEKIPDFSKSRYDSKKMNWTLGSVEKFPTGYYYESLNVWKKAIEKDSNFAGINWKKSSGNPTITPCIDLNKSALELDLKKTYTLKVSKSSNLKNEQVTWSTSNKSVATISSKGKVTAKNTGIATITAKCGGAVAKCIIVAGNYKPDTPILKKAISSEKGKIKITWKKVEGVDGYIIYKEHGEYREKIGTTTSNITTYTVTGLKSGKKYSYFIEAYKKIEDTTYYSYMRTVGPIKVK